MSYEAQLINESTGEGLGFPEPDDYNELIAEDERARSLEAEIDRQRALGYETFDDYIKRTGFPRDEASYAAFIGEGRWMLTSEDKPL